MNCNIEVKIGNNEPELLHSDMALDRFLASQAPKLLGWYKIKDVNQLDKIFSFADDHDSAIVALDGITKKYNKISKKTSSHVRKKIKDVLSDADLRLGSAGVFENIDDYIEVHKLDSAISVTTLIESVGNKYDLHKPTVTGVNSNYELMFKDKKRTEFTKDILKDENRQLTKEEKQKIERLVQDAWMLEDAKGKRAALVGEDIHYILECLFNNTDVDTSKFSTMTVEQYEKYKSNIYDIYQSIKSRFSDKAKFYTEFDIVSDDLPSSIKRALEHAGHSDIKRVSGRIDLLVIDENGKAHIFDWKTAAKPVGSWGETNNAKINAEGWWHSTKKLKAFAQLGNYGAILEQNNIEVETMELIPIYVEFGSNDASGFNNLIKLEKDKSVSSTESNSYCLRQKRSARYTFSVTRPIKLNKLADIWTTLNGIFPGANLDAQQLKHFDATVEYYKKKPGFITPVKKGTVEYDKGNRHKFYTIGLPDKEFEYCTDDNLDEKLAEYVQKLNEFMLNQMGDFSEDLTKVIHSQGAQLDIDRWLMAFTNPSKDYLKNVFKKYYTNGWQITLNEALNNNGIFIFKKDNNIDIIALSEKDLHMLYDLKSPNGKTQHNITGFAVEDGDPGTDPAHLMNAQFGNLMLMKIAALIAYNPEIVDDAKINTIKIVNPWHRTMSEAHSNEFFYNNWNTIVAKYRKEKLPLLYKDWFTDDVVACVQEAAECMRSVDLELSGDMLKPIVEQSAYTEEMIINLMNRISSAANLTYLDTNTTAGFAYYQLQLALMHIRGIHVYEDPDVGDYVDGKVWFVGNMVSSASQSKSINVRTMEKVFAAYRDAYMKNFNDVAEPFMKDVDEVYKEWGFNKSVNSAREFWKILYENKGNDMDPRYMFKHPNHSDFKNKPKTKKLLESVLFQLYLAKHPNISPDELDLATSKDEYYEVPLVEVGLAQTVAKNYNAAGLKGVFDGIWQSIKDAGNKLDTLYSGTDTQNHKSYQTALEKQVVYNKYLNYTPEERTKLLDSNRAFETDLERIFLAAMASDAVQKASEKYGHYFVAFHSALKYLYTVHGLDIPKITKFAEKWIENKVFMRQIMDDSLSTFHSMLKVLRKVSSTVTLGLSTRSMTREILVSTYTTYTRAATHQLPGISPDVFADAMLYVMKQAPVSFNVQNMISAMNRQYAMTDYSRTEMADTNRRAHWGLQNMSSSDVFITTRLSDNYFRMAILIAKMKADGCFEAHSVEEDNLIYDFNKDKRFSLYANYKLSEVAKEDLIKWKEQESLYLHYLAEWQDAYPELNLEIGDPLPQAYPPSIKASIRLIANELYGFFDNEDKSLLTATFLGSAFMQYKTWLSAKLNQHMKSPGFVNIWQFIPQKDEDGDELWIVIASDEERANGEPVLRYVKKQDVLPEWIEEGRAEPWMIEEGTFQEGTIMATGEFLKDIIKWDLDSFKLHWEDPVKRGQLINGLSDTLGMLVLIGIIQALFGEDVTNNRASQDWITQWSYGVLMGFAEDGPVNKIIGSTFSDINPPSLLALQKWADTVNSVLAGNKSVGQGLVESFGATREFRGYFR